MLLQVLNAMCECVDFVLKGLKDRNVSCKHGTLYDQCMSASLLYGLNILSIVFVYSKVILCKIPTLSVYAFDFNVIDHQWMSGREWIYCGCTGLLFIYL